MVQEFEARENCLKFLRILIPEYNQSSTPLKHQYCAHTWGFVAAMLGSLHDDSDVKETGKKAIGLGKQNNNSACTSDFFVHFFAAIERLRCETF